MCSHFLKFKAFLPSNDPMSRMGKNNRAVVVHKGGKKTKKSLLNPLIKELYRITGISSQSSFYCCYSLQFIADVTKSTGLEEICKQGDIIESKESSFVAPSYNLNRVDAANDLICHLRSQVSLFQSYQSFPVSNFSIFGQYYLHM